MRLFSKAPSQDDASTEKDILELRSLLKPLAKIEPSPSLLARWKHYLGQMGEGSESSPRFNLGLQTFQLRWILAGNLSLVLLALFFLPVPEVSTRGHILSFELDPHSAAAYRSVAGLPWLQGTHYSVSHPVSKDGLTRTHLHLFCLDKSEEEAAKWAEEILATPTVHKVKILPVVVDESLPVYQHLLEKLKFLPSHHKDNLEKTVAEHLRHLSSGKAGKLSPIFSNELLAEVFEPSVQSQRIESLARDRNFPADRIQPVSFPER